MAMRGESGFCWGAMCAQPSLPVVPDNSSSSSSASNSPRGHGRRNEESAVKKPPSIWRKKSPIVLPAPASVNNIPRPRKPDAKTRCTKCGSKTHPTSKCVDNERKCARCSDPNNTQQCQIVVMQTRLMKTFRSRGDHRQVQSTLRGLRRDGHRPTKESYTLLLSSLILSGRMQEGPSLLQQMEADNVVPDAIFFNTLLNGYCEARMMEAGFR